MNHSDNWYRIQNIEELDTPALVVYPDRIKYNIRTAIDMVGDVKRLRPHIKTHKSAEVCRLMLAAGIHQFKCATIAEAELLGLCGAKDVLLAYQPLGPKLRRFIELIKKYPGTEYGCLTDNASALHEQAVAFRNAGITVPVFIDLNIGMNRTGITPGEAAVQLYEMIHSLESVRAGGLHAYDGQLRSPDIEERTRQCEEGFKPVEAMKASLEKKGYAVPVVIAGGSPAFPIHAKRNWVQCSPGTFIYWDKGYSDLCPEQSFLPAAVLVTRVISLPSLNRITTDLGHKSVAAENEIGKRIFFLNAEGLKPVGQSEEHLVLEANEDHPYKPGDILYGLPFHICPTVALYESVHPVTDHQVSGEWKNSARDRRMSV